MVADFLAKHGRHIEGAKCPGCRAKTVVYNGNYFCTSCDWAMDQNDPAHRPAADRRILRLAGVDTGGRPLREKKS